MNAFLAKDDSSKARSAQSCLPFSDNFLTGLARGHIVKDWYPRLETGFSVYVDCTENVRVAGRNYVWPRDAIDSVSDVTLVKVFRCLHPVDRVRSAALVCKRWNRLLYEKGIWTELVLKKLTRNRAPCARAFLKKISLSLRKLYVGTSSGALADVLPLELPYVTFFELHECRGFKSIESDVNSGFKFPDDLLLLDRCMPNLRCLVIEALLRVVDRRLESSWEVNLGLLNASGAFGRLESASLSFMSMVWWLLELSDVSVLGVEEFLDARPSLEHLRIVDYCTMQSDRSRETLYQSKARFGSLKQLTLQGRDEGGRLLSFREMPILRFQPENLVFFETVHFPRPSDVNSLRKLHSLEHLHVSVMVKWFTGFTLASLFGPPAQPNHFPSRLKYLRLAGDYVPFTADEMLEIARNCPELRALRCTYGEVHGEVIRALGQSLCHLRMVQVDCLSDLGAVLDAAGGRGVPFPRLRFVTACGFHPNYKEVKSQPRIAESVLHSLFTKKPDLVVHVGGRFITYRIHEETNLWIGGWIKDRDSRIWDALKADEGWCCVRRPSCSWWLSDDSDADDDPQTPDEDIYEDIDSITNSTHSTQDLTDDEWSLETDSSTEFEDSESEDSHSEDSEDGNSSTAVSL